MTDFSAWFSPAVMRLVAWALLHFLWQGLVLAALFAGLMATFRSASHALCAGGFDPGPHGRGPDCHILVPSAIRRTIRPADGNISGSDNSAGSGSAGASGFTAGRF